jgi:hypothetical protein
MASTANSVSLSTNFNVAPFYDDFNESKNFHRILFRPGLAVQARELTQMQTIFQNQIDRFAEHIFQEGSSVRGFELNYDPDYQYVKLRNNNSVGTSVNAAAFLNNVIKGSTSGVLATVIKTNDGSEANTPNFKTFYVKYLSANTTTGYRYFANNEIISSITTVGLAANTITAAQGGATGAAAALKVGSGIVYAKDHFIRVPEQTVLVGKYTSAPSARVGFDVTESIITETTDETLLDPASGSYNYAAPGAARLKLEVTIKSQALTTAVSNTFVELMQVKDGAVQSIASRPKYSEIRKYLAERTYDESGDYVIRGLNVTMREHLKSGNNQGIYTSGEGGNTSLLVAVVDSGKAYVKGFDNEIIVSSRINVNKGTTYNVTESAKVLPDYSNYILVDNVCGQWDVNGQGTVSLRDSQANSIYNNFYSVTGFAGAHIGRARVRGIELDSGTPGTQDARYRLYLTDVVMNSGKDFRQTQFIGWNGGTGAANGKADIVASTGLSANAVGTTFNRAIFRLPSKATKTLRNASNVLNNDFNFYKAFDIASVANNGTFTISSGDATETFDGSGSLSSTAINSDFYVVASSAANTVPLTGNVSISSGGSTVTWTGAGTQTIFDKQICPGDIINIGTAGDFTVKSVDSATSITTEKTAPSTCTNVSFFKKIKSGQVINLAGVGSQGTSMTAGTRTVSVANTTASIDLKERFRSTFPAKAVVKLNKIDGQEAAKTVVRNRLVQIYIDNSTYATTATEFNLGLSDGLRIVSVRRKAGSAFSSTSEGTNVTANFILDNGQNDNYYDHAKLKMNPSKPLTLSLNDRLLVTLDHFTHSFSSGIGYFSVDSYPVNDATAASDTSKIFTYEIPIYVSKSSGGAYDLRDCIDMRPRIIDTATSTAIIGTVSTNPATSTSVYQPTGGLHFSPPNEDFTTDLQYYLGRSDVVVMSQEGRINLIAGTPSVNPKAPAEIGENMPLATLTIAPYPSLPYEIARRANRLDSANKIKKALNPRFTMKDIGEIAKRIDRLEYYTSLNMLEKSTNELLIRDENGLNRFKNGFLVDPFNGHGIGNVYDPDYKISIDDKASEMRPLNVYRNTKLRADLLSSTHVVRTNVTTAGVYKDQVITLTTTPASGTFVAGATVTSGGSSATIRHRVGNKLYVENATGNFAASATITSNAVNATISSVAVTAPGDIVTLPYSHKVLVQQPYATTTRNAAGTSYSWKGVLKLDPDNDYWYDTTAKPEINVNIDGNADAIAYIATTMGIKWDDWKTTFVGEPVLISQNTVETGSSSSSSRTNGGTETTTTTSFTTESVYSVPSTEVRSGTQFNTSITDVKQTVGNVVTDVSIQQYMRARTITGNAVGMKPSSRLYAFFDGIDVSSYITPLTEAEFLSGLKNSQGASVAPTSARGSALYSNTDGSAYFLFTIPNNDGLRFRTGSKRLRLTDNAQNSSTYGQFTTSAESEYSAEGLALGKSDITTSTRKVGIWATNPSETKNVTTFNTEYSFSTTVDTSFQQDPPNNDPIAQTFTIDALRAAKNKTSGLYLTKLDLFFATKDPKLSVTVQLQEVDKITGTVTPRVVPFSSVTLTPAEVNASETDSTVPTQVYFPAPVYLQEGSDYAIVVVPEASNPNYTVWTAVLGDNDLATGGRVAVQPASGFLYTSSNQRSWVPVENEDMKFTTYYAEFDKSADGQLILKNDKKDFLTVTSLTGTYVNAIGEVIHGETRILGTFANTKAVAAQIANGTCYVQSSNATATITGVVTEYNSAYIMARVDTSAKFANTNFVRLRFSSPTSGVIVANSTGKIKGTITPVGRVEYYDAVNYANTKLYVANLAYTTSGVTSSCTFNRIIKANTWLSTQSTNIKSKVLSVDNVPVDYVQVFAGTIIPSNTYVSAYGKFATSSSARDTSYIYLNLNNSDELDATRYILSRSNESNTSVSSATMYTGSVDIKLQMNCRNITASPVVDLSRVALTGVHNLISTDTEIGSSEDNVASGGNSKSRYITRIVTLADDQDAEDIRVYLGAYRPPGTQVHVYCKVLNASDSDTFAERKWIEMTRDTDQGFTPTAVYSSSTDKNDFLELVYKVPDWTDTYKAGANNSTGIFQYRNSTGARFNGFKYFAIKVVLTADSSPNPPRVRELRAIALQR